MRNLAWYAVMAVMIGLVGCQKKQSSAAAEKSSMVADSERSRHFAAVNKHLELGGVLYGYMDVDGDVEKIGLSLTQMGSRIAAMQPDAKMAAQDYTAILKELGFSGLKAFGLSSVQTDGGFRNRAFFYIPEGRTGLLAIAGGPAAPFEHARLAPADTDVFLEAELDVPSAYAAIRSVIARVGGEEALKQVEENLKKAQPGQPSAYDLIQQMKGRFTVVIRLNPGEKISIPAGGKQIDVPGISLLLRADGIGAGLEPVIAQLPMLQLVEEGGHKFFQLPQPLPGGKLQPAFVFEGGVLWLGSDRAFLTECLQRTGGLDQQSDFKAAINALGPEGNALVHVSPRLFSTARTLLRDIVEKNPEAAPIIQAWADGIPEVTKPVTTVRINLPDGILVRSFSFQSLKQDVFIFSSASPVTVGLLAAMAIPAFQKVRTNSQEKIIQNNLRQFAAAAQQHMLETDAQRATYTDIVGPGKYIKELKPVAGENYRSLVVKSTDSSISVRTSKGKMITVRF